MSKLAKAVWQRRSEHAASAVHDQARSAEIQPSAARGGRAGLGSSGAAYGSAPNDAPCEAPQRALAFAERLRAHSGSLEAKHWALICQNVRACASKFSARSGHFGLASRSHERRSTPQFLSSPRQQTSAKYLTGAGLHGSELACKRCNTQGRFGSKGAAAATGSEERSVGRAQPDCAAQHHAK